MAIIMIFNGWMLLIIKGIRDDLVEVRKWFVDHLAKCDPQSANGRR